MKNLILIIGLISIYCFSFNNLFSQDKYLLIVDVQKKFYEKTEIEIQANEMVQKINQMINKFEPQNVIYIKATGKILSVSSKGFKVTPMLPAPELDSNLKIVSNNIFTKLEGNAFTLEDLNKFLTDNKAKEIIIVGLLAEKCIYYTAIGGKEKGYDISIVSEAVISKSKGKKEKTFKKLIKKGIKILTINDIINVP
jgi:nicotinamidase-related amidase